MLSALYSAAFVVAAAAALVFCDQAPLKMQNFRKEKEENKLLQYMKYNVVYKVPGKRTLKKIPIFQRSKRELLFYKLA